MRSVVHAGVRAALRVLAAEAALYDQFNEPYRSRGHRAVLLGKAHEPVLRRFVARHHSEHEHPANYADPACAAHLPRAEARAPPDRPAGTWTHVEQLVPRALPICALPLPRRRHLRRTHLFRREEGERQHVQLDSCCLLVLY